MLDIKSVRLRTEEDIIAAWIDKESIVVSVICATYNHELYIEDAIAGFLMQETDFAFEIIIHDDASTDHTAYIIKRYEKLYPNIIRAIYQSENRYSRGGFKPGLYTASFARGKLLALCEGDDYWIDSSKMASQYNVFVQNEEVEICFTPAVELNIDINSQYVICQHYRDSCIVSLENVIIGRGGWMPSASVMISNKNIDKLSRLIEGYPIADFFLQVYKSLEGQCYYLNRVSVVYRRNAIGSWTSSMKINKERLLFTKNMLLSVDRFSGSLNHDKRLDPMVSVASFYLMSNIDRTQSKRIKAATLFRLLCKLKHISKCRIVFYLMKKKTLRILGKMHHG